MRIRRTLAGLAIGAGALALAGCTPGGPPTPDQVAKQFAESIEPAWQVDVPGLFGDVVVRDGLVVAYAIDDETGMRLTVHSLDTGELVWEHTASPGGADANPLLVSKDAASRPYPLPTIRPIVVERGEGEDAQPVVVFFERDIPEEGSIMPDDLLRVADARTGDLLDVALPEVDPDEFTFASLGFHDDGEVFANTTTPGFPCEDGGLCFVADDEETSGSGLIRLDVDALEARFEPGYIPDTEDTSSPEWGRGFARLVRDDRTYVARYDAGAEVWSAAVDDLFQVERTSPADSVDFVRVGDLVLIQGYQPIIEMLDPGEPHTLSLDFVTSRTLIAVNAATGEVAWRLPGGDMLCEAVHQRPIEADATSIPACLATSGSFVYDVEAGELVDQEDVASSIVQVNVADGSVGWKAEGAGIVSLSYVGRLLDVVFASGPEYAVEQVGEDVTLVHLTDGEAVTIPADEGDGPAFVCKAEREDVLPEFEGSIFAGGGNAITTGYPAGWYHFACDEDGGTIDRWSRGAVEVAAIGDPAGMVVLPLEDSLVGFDLQD